MLGFCRFIKEAWDNGIGPDSREKTVTDNTRYGSPSDYKKGSIKVGSVGPLELHSVDNGQGGVTHFTWHPKDKKIHHVIHSVEKTKTSSGGTQLKYLSAHGRKKSPIRMGQVYSTLAKDHNTEFVGTGHSTGAQKMWSRFHDDPDLEVVGRHPSGQEVPLTKDSPMYASKKTKNPAERKIGQMSLVLRKKQQSGN
jgi:hypothetical protein